MDKGIFWCKPKRQLCLPSPRRLLAKTGNSMASVRMANFVRLLTIHRTETQIRERTKREEKEDQVLDLQVTPRAKKDILSIAQAVATGKSQARGISLSLLAALTAADLRHHLDRQKVPLGADRHRGAPMVQDNPDSPISLSLQEAARVPALVVEETRERMAGMAKRTRGRGSREKMDLFLSAQKARSQGLSPLSPMEEALGPEKGSLFPTMTLAKCLPVHLLQAKRMQSVAMRTSQRSANMATNASTTTCQIVRSSKRASAKMAISASSSTLPKATSLRRMDTKCVFDSKGMSGREQLAFPILFMK